MIPRENRTKFTEILEIVFALFMTTSLYNILGRIDKLSWLIAAKFFLCAFILVRFFFAPTINIEIMLKDIKPLRRKLYILFFDFPILIIHSVIFYFICNSFFPKYKPDSISFTPFTLIAVLLFLNAFWLCAIQRRLWLWKKKLIFRLIVWITNNTLCGALLLIISNMSLPFLIKFIIMIVIGYFNCLVDISRTAPDYLGQRKPQIVEKVFGIPMWGNY